MTRRHSRLAAALLAALLLSAAPAWAQRPDSRRPPESQQRISLDDAIAQVQRRTGGRVLAAQAADGSYRIKVLTREGEVRVFQVDAMSGRIESGN